MIPRITLLSILVLQTSAFSYFEEYYTQTYTAVDNNFNRLVNDVVANVQVTIDCTVLGVKKALSLGGMFGEFDHSKYEEKCKDANGNIILLTDYQPSSYSPTVQLDLGQSSNAKENQSDLQKELSQEIANSISIANKTVNDYLDREPYRRIAYGKDNLRDEAERLFQADSILYKELDRVSTKEIESCKTYDIDRSKPIVENIKEEIKILHGIDQQHKQESKEIQHVFDRVLDVLHINSTSNLSTDAQVKTIMDDLKFGSLNKTIIEIKNEFPKLTEVEEEADNEVMDSEKEVNTGSTDSQQDDIKHEDLNSSNDENANHFDNDFVGRKHQEVEEKDVQEENISKSGLSGIVDAIEKSSNETIAKIENTFSQWKEDIKENVQINKEEKDEKLAEEVIEDIEKRSDDTMKDIEDEITQWKEEEKQYIDDIKQNVDIENPNPIPPNDEKLTKLIKNIEITSSETLSNIENKLSELHEVPNLKETNLRQSDISGYNYDHTKTENKIDQYLNTQNKQDDAFEKMGATTNDTTVTQTNQQTMTETNETDVKPSVVTERTVVQNTSPKGTTDDDIADNLREYFEQLFTSQENTEVAINGTVKPGAIDLSMTDTKTASVFNKYFAPKDRKVIDKKAEIDAQSLIAQNEETKNIMDNVLKSADSQNSAINLFDNPDFLSFG